MLPRKSNSLFLTLLEEIHGYSSLLALLEEVRRYQHRGFIVLSTAGSNPTLFTVITVAG